MVTCDYLVTNDYTVREDTTRVPFVQPTMKRIIRTASRAARPSDGAQQPRGSQNLHGASPLGRCVRDNPQKDSDETTEREGSHT